MLGVVFLVIVFRHPELRGGSQLRCDRAADLLFYKFEDFFGFLQLVVIGVVHQRPVLSATIIPRVHGGIVQR